ncbi:MAG: hypothetical protein Tsb002_18380 [Wenzhouxiangellaceae bacterium]
MTDQPDQPSETDADHDDGTLSLLLEALSQPQNTRTDWVLTQEQYPPNVIDTVLRILANEHQAGPLEQPYDTGADDHHRIGQIIGEYRLTELLGRGGMGAVYLAERVRDFEHHCALKLIRSGQITPANREHFLRERQILADMQHPYISHFLGGGVTPEGDDYLLMERLEGVAITTYCDQHTLDTRQRLKLFCCVCQALEYAHSKLLVHGDIKPSNILVTHTGDPKLLDFGIAQHLRQPLGEQQRALSRDFASPEQRQQRKLSVASDIYSLCTLLQVLLSGLMPGNHQTQTIAPELHSIINKGRQAQPQNRYTNTTQLLEDCQRFLRHEPVAAHSRHWTYRTRKLLWRRRWAVIAGLILSASLIGGTAVSLWQADIARQQKNQAQQFSQALVGLLNAPDPYADGSARTVEDMLDHAVDQLRDGNNSLPLAVRDDLLITVGQVYLNIGATNKAADVAALIQTHWPADGSHESILYAKAQNFSGVLASRQGDYSKAEEQLELAQRWYRQSGTFGRAAAANAYELGRLYLLSAQEQQARTLWSTTIQQLSEVNEPWVTMTLSQIHNDLGIADEFAGDLQSARRHYFLSINYFPSKDSLAAATQLGNLASVERKLGNIEQAIEIFKQSLQMHFDVVGPDHKEVSMIHSDLAWAYADNRQIEQALHHAQLALDNALRESGQRHRNTAAAYFALGNAELINQQYNKARLHLQQALEIREQLLGKDHARTLDVAVSLAQTGCATTAGRAEAQTRLSEIIQQLQQSDNENQFYLQRAGQVMQQCHSALTEPDQT